MEARDDNHPWPKGINRINRLYYYNAREKNKTACDPSNNIDLEPTAVNASSQTSAITSSGSSGYGLFLIVLMFIVLAAINGRQRFFNTGRTG